MIMYAISRSECSVLILWLNEYLLSNHFTLRVCVAIEHLERQSTHWTWSWSAENNELDEGIKVSLFQSNCRRKLLRKNQITFQLMLMWAEFVFFVFFLFFFLELHLDFFKLRKTSHGTDLSCVSGVSELQLNARSLRRVFFSPCYRI